MKTSNLTPFNPGKLENHLSSWGCLKVQTPSQTERQGKGGREEREGGEKEGKREGGRKDGKRSPEMT